MHPVARFASKASDSESGGRERITAALVLAAGVGRRLSPLTRDIPKCLVEVDGEPILGRLVRSLAERGFERLVVVDGHRGHRIRDYLTENSEGLSVHFVHNPRYASTNNLYSLWLAKPLIRSSFLLLESDIVFDPDLLSGLLVPDRIAVATMSPSMFGTTVMLDAFGNVTAFSVGSVDRPDPAAKKTVNIYSLSWNTWQHVVSRLDRRVANIQLQDYYEVVFAELVAEKRIHFGGVSFDRGRWIEIDSKDDLRAAEILFRRPGRPHNDLVGPLPIREF